MINQNYLLKCKKLLTEIPPPGGNGCHPALLGIANYGVMARLTPEQIYLLIRSSIPPGRRKVTDREIYAAIDKAFSDQKKPIILSNGKIYNRYTSPKVKPVIHSGKITLQNIRKQGIISTEAALCDMSPIPLYEKRIYDTTLFLNTLYNPNDLIWMGERCDPGIIGKNIRTISEWINLINLTKLIPSFFIINPLSGKPATKLTGNGETYRGDRNVLMFKYALVEFDNISLEDQIQFWSAIKLPIRCLVHTGGKSIHALLDVQKMAKIETLDQWHTQIKNHLYDKLLTPMGVDSACSNPARLSRLPGHYRVEKNSRQRIIWLSPDGRSVSNA